MKHPAEAIITTSNVSNWPTINGLFEAGKVVADCTGRLRYPHGAPVGKMVLARVNKDGTPIYRESAEEWFDPDSPRAKSFVWPTA